MQRQKGFFFFKWNIKQEKFKLACKIIEKVWKAIYQNITSRQSLSTKQREWRDLGEPTAWLFYFPLSLVALLKMPMVEPLEATQFHLTPLCPLWPNPSCPVMGGGKIGTCCLGVALQPPLQYTISFSGTLWRELSLSFTHTDRAAFPGDFWASHVILPLLFVTISFRVYNFSHPSRTEVERRPCNQTLPEAFHNFECFSSSVFMENELIDRISRLLSCLFLVENQAVFMRPMT